ncbi:MBL fold metallo-hydrolase RNA specificity domain-containing protein [Nitrosococcus halophilus]|uniref:MBL fold metallo-hydrolase RNA specificity domain-containing protein n=1 Tax=Nitrosococcus halophilus TaxID=133539 RepID=UPI000312573C|nr:MBL fold metallo-hydrolase [Nitrosococcus halophilus]
MQIQFLGAAGEVTGSCHLVQVGEKKILLDCGLIQGRPKDEARNREPFPFDPETIDAVVLSHAHIDHSGRLPLLIKSGYSGPVYTHRATADLCRTMLRDAGFLSEKDAEWENRKRERKGLPLVEPLFTIQDVEAALGQFKELDYGRQQTILPGVSIRLSDAGHILGSAVTELWLSQNGQVRKLVYSGDLGRSGMPILADPTPIQDADLVVMESTYGNRLHRTWVQTLTELKGIFNDTLTNGKGNILIPAFAVGRTQEILYLFAKYYEEWGLERWYIFLDSPMAAEATDTYARNSQLFDRESSEMWRRHQEHSLLPNLRFTRTAQESMQLNKIRSGAIIIAGSGMCDGGRIKHHLKHNAWRKDCHIIITGYQASGTLGRSLVDGAKYIKLWGETIRVAASVHTVGGLSAHADQAGLMNWYAHFQGRPPLVLVHGEAVAAEGLAKRLREDLAAPVRIAQPASQMDLGHLGNFIGSPEK